MTRPPGVLKEDHSREISQLLENLKKGEPDAFNKLFPLVYRELRSYAHRERNRWNGDLTLNTTAIVHETYLKLVDQKQANWEDRAHFMGIAAKAMRHILINYAQKRKALKRGGHLQKVEIDDLEGFLAGDITLSEERADTLLVLDQSLKRLTEIDPRLSQIVECRFFGGMTIEDTASALHLSPSTVKRSWVTARAWLFQALKE